MRSKPPKFVYKLLDYFCPDYPLEGILGDLEEQFIAEVTSYGHRRARWNYTINALRFFRPGILLRNKIKSYNFNYNSLHGEVGPLVMTMNYEVIDSGLEDIGKVSNPIPKLVVRVEDKNIAEAVPVTLIFINQWLDSFAYRITPGVNVFLITRILSVVIALMTKAYHVINTANRQPAEVLKYE